MVLGAALAWVEGILRPGGAATAVDGWVGVEGWDGWLLVLVLVLVLMLVLVLVFVLWGAGGYAGNATHLPAEAELQPAVAEFVTVRRCQPLPHTNPGHMHQCGGRSRGNSGAATAARPTLTLVR